MLALDGAGLFYIFCMELDGAGLFYIFSIWSWKICWLWSELFLSIRLHVQCVSSARSRCTKEAPRAKGSGLIGFEDLGFRALYFSGLGFKVLSGFRVSRV